MTEQHIRKKKSLDIVAVLGNKGNREGLPTWLPNWFSNETWSTNQVGYLQPKVVSVAARSYSVWQSQAGRMPAWTAHGKSETLYSVHDFHVLRAKGVFLGSVCACSGTLGEASVPSYQNVRPCQPPSWFRKSHEKLWALSQVFRLQLKESGEILNVWNRESDGNRDPGHSQYEGGLKQSSPPEIHSKSSDWLKRHSEFEIFGETLSSILRGAAPFQVGETRFSVCWKTICCIPICLLEFMGTDVREIERYQGNIYKNMVLDLGMRLGYGEFGLGWLDEKTRAGDQVALLMGCSIPVVLRRRPGGGFTMVGDALVYGAMHGEKMDETRCDFIEIH